jgi:hypothetical protein
VNPETEGANVRRIAQLLKAAETDRGSTPRDHAGPLGAAELDKIAGGAWLPPIGSNR